MKITKKQYKKIRREAIIDMLLYEAFIIFGAGLMVYGIMF